MRCFKISQRVSFICMIFFTSSFFFVEIIVGYITNSMALVADSFHMLSDVVSLLVGYLAFKFTSKGTATEHYTFGWARAEVLGALVNAVFLVALCFSIIVEALKRIIMPEQLDDARLVLITGGVGLFVNIVGLFLFHQHGHGGHSHGAHGHSHGGSESHNDLEGTMVPLSSDSDKRAPLMVAQDDTKEEESSMKDEEGKPAGSLNVRGVYLHVLGDALGSVIVMISAVIIMYTNEPWTKYVDPSLSIIMVLIILKTSFPLLKESCLILMQTVPTHINIQEIQDKLVETVPGILSVHEFHIWQLAGNKIIASAHVHCKTLMEYMAIAGEVKEFFHNQGIHSTTIQPEFMEPILTKPSDCLLECKNSICSNRTCCGSGNGSTASPSVVSNKTSLGSGAHRHRDSIDSTVEETVEMPV